MPHKTTTASSRQQRAVKAERARKILAGVTRDDSDDELGVEDHPWEWIYEKEEIEEDAAAYDSEDESKEDKASMARRRRSRAVRYGHSNQRIIGARMGKFKCKIGDCVLLKAEGTNSAWVGIICEFMEDDEGEKEAKFMCMKLCGSGLAFSNVV
jgi:origin recognition complex subunit 1